jgi:sigma-E factor negative regulatory protein RseB
MRSVLRRPVLLLSVAATITVPGALAALAVLGHHHEDTVATTPRPASLGPQLSPGGQQAAMLPAGEVRTGHAPNIRAMVPASTTAAADRVRGTKLLSQAAAAGRVASYQGVESIADTTVTGLSTVMATVWHRGGGLTVTRVAGGQPEETYDSNGRAPEGVFGVTTTLVGLLDKNYVPMYLGTGSATGRSALVVAVQRADGTTAAQFWLDERTLVPLRRAVYDTSAHLVSDDRFTKVRFGTANMPKVAAGPGRVAWATVPSPVQLLSRLNGEGCLLPSTLPGDLSLYAASEATTPSGQVADFGFSDGLSVVSLFVERGVLPAKIPGWQPDRIGGHVVYVAQHEVTMSGNGFVYTLISDAPPKTVNAVVAALPDDRNPGLLGRLGRGLDRIVSVLNPFG